MFTAEELSASLAKAREAARHAKARSPPQAKHWTWLVQALWSGVGRTKVRLAVPETVVWEGGVPTRWLATDDRGFLVRKDLGAPGARLRRDADEHDDFFSRERVKMLRRAFAAGVAAGDAICVAEYADGLREELTAAQLDALGAHREWRLQLRMLQARVRARRIASGVYARDAPDSLAPRAEAAAQAATALAEGRGGGDHRENVASLAAALARFAEATYAPTADGADTRIEVGSLAVEVAIDDVTGRLWVLRTTELEVTFVNRAPEREDAKKAAARAQAREDAKSCAAQLHRLLRLAAKRGVAFEASYAHFDATGVGRVDRDRLQAGLRLLGFSLSDEAADYVLERISGTTTFSPEDLWKFAGFEGPCVHPRLSVPSARPGDDNRDDRANDDASWRDRARQMMLRSRSARATSTTLPSLCPRPTSRAPTRVQLTTADKKRLWGTDPLGTVPGARTKTRRAMLELMEAAKRRKKKHAAGGGGSGGPAASSPVLERPPSLRPTTASSRPTSAGSSKVTEALDPVAHPGVSETAAGDGSSRADSFFHVEPGLVVTYRMLRGRPPHPPDHSDAAHVLAQDAAARNAERHLRNGGNAPTATRFLLVLLPDIFHTLDTLEAAVAPVLTNLYGAGDALLVGLPGLPHTCWPSDAPLNNALFADCLARLLAHLKQQGEILVNRDMARRLCFVGFGNGACTLARFFAPATRDEDEENDKKRDEYRSATAAAVLFNCFFACEGPVRRALSSLSKVFARGTHEERLQAIVDTHFSAKFLLDQGRDSVLRAFWATRSALALADADNGIGLRAMLRGALAHQDVRPSLSMIEVPLVLVQSAANRFVPAQRAPEDLAAARSEDRHFSPTPADAILAEERGAHVAYLDTGHELLLERPAYLTSLLVQVICAAMPVLTLAGTTGSFVADEARAALASNLCDALRNEVINDPLSVEFYGDRRRQEEEAIVEATDGSLPSGLEDIEERDEPNGAEEIDGVEEEKCTKNDADITEQEAPTQVTTQSRRSSAERAMRVRQASQLQKEKAHLAKRKREITQLREVESEEARKAQQVAERFAMRAEDLHSYASREYDWDVALYERGISKAEERATYLTTARDAEEALEIEDRLKRERARERAEERLQEAKQVQRTLNDIGVREQDAADNVMELASKAKLSVEKLLSSRRQLVQALQQCALLEQTVAKFRSSLESADHEARRLERTIRLLETNVGLRGSLAPKARELDELRVARDTKVDEQAHLRHLAEHRSRKLDFANQVAQALKTLVAKRDAEARALKCRLEQLARRLREERGARRMFKDKAAQIECELHTAISVVRKRHAVVKRELVRLRNYAGKHVNCEVWTGYMQRMETHDLRTSLISEKQKLEKQLSSQEMKRDTLEQQRRAASREQTRLDAEASAVEEIFEMVSQTYDEATRVSIQEELRNLEKEQEMAETELKESEATAAIQRRMEASMAGDCVAARVRHKNAMARSTDEKRWVALDVVVNPAAYAHVTETEAEEMRFDPDYVPRLRADDVERIIQLPHQVQLALPFLFNQDEIEAHRLLCQYTHEEGEAYHNLVDRTGGAHSRHDPNDIGPHHTNKQRELVAEQVASQRWLDVVLRERRLARLRSKTRPELSEDEAKYLAIDRILNPWLYEATQKTLEVPSTSASMEHDGDKYESLRQAYEAGVSDLDLGFEPAWIPRQNDGRPHDRDSLLEAVLEVPDEKNEVCALLAEYYVDDRVTPRGKRDRETIRDLGESMDAADRRHQERQQHIDDFEARDAMPTWACGGWDVVHPASSGRNAQLRQFGEGCDLGKVHPASFICSQTTSTNKNEDIMADTNKFFGTIFQDLEGLTKLQPAQISNARDVLFEFEGQETRLLSEEGQSLEMRGSRTHCFEVPEETDRRLLSLTITIVYRGVFTARGYRPGRLAAAAFRLQTSTSGFAMTIATGYAPYEKQQLNTGTALGRIVIVHKPDKVPITPGPYHVVLGAASETKYSITVDSQAAQVAEAKLRSERQRAEKAQERLRVCKVAIEDMWTSMRLAERKLLVVQGLLDEAQVESSRCEQETERCNQELVADDERMELTDEQRAGLYTEVRRLEVEFAHWCRLLASRSQERRDLLAGLKLLRDERSARIIEVEGLERDVKWLQRHLPAATRLVHGIEPAIDCAIALNTNFEFIQAENASGQWQKLASAKGIITAMMTPAQEVRRRYKAEGWTNLNLPEQQWTVLDRTMNPDLYEWLQESDAAKEYDFERATSLNRAVRALKNLTRGEVLRIESLSFNRLTRGTETTVWKLRRRFHDDPRRLIDYSKRRGMVVDADLAAATRFKHPNSWTREEREWVSLDKILNPELWRGLKIRSETVTPYHNVLTADQKREYLEPLEEDEGDVDQVRRSSQIGSKFGSLVQVTMAQRTALVAAQASGKGDVCDSWVCTLKRDELLDVWASREQNPTWTVDQCKARRLMEKYNGDYETYSTMCEDIRRNKEAAKPHRFCMNRVGEPFVVETDLDARCRVLQAELDKANHNSNATMTSNILHGGVGQRFPTHILRLELEAELDALLREQVYERERAQRYLLEQEDDWSSVDSSGDENAAARKKPENNISKEVYLARKAILREQGKDEVAKQFEREIAVLGPSGCVACLAPRCQWRSMVDVKAAEARRQVISDELVYVRLNPQTKTFESYVPLSASRGGNPHFRREDLIHELTWEDKQLGMRLQLNTIDRELHDAYATRKEYMEVRALHAYPTIMWTSNARRALEREHNRHVATLVANDIVDDALAWMFEGWYFGEHESSYSVAGYVPSLKSDGFIRPGGDQILAQSNAEDRDLARAAAEAAGAPVPDAALVGSPRSKAEGIEAEAQFRLTGEKVVKANSDREKHMDFTERTLKFGLFCITLMFFRAMALIRREKESWSGAHDAIGDADGNLLRAKPTKERQRMRREHQRARERLDKLDVALSRAKVGEERKRNRIAKEREEAARKLHAKIRREKQELAACGLLQAVYRGHLGRKAARRWAIKRAELEALNALMTASAVTIERVYRGFVGRTRASVARMEMADFISMIRMEEAQEDEDEYWRTHPYARLKRNVRVLAKDFIASRARSNDVTDEELELAAGLTASLQNSGD